MLSRDKDWEFFELFSETKTRNRCASWAEPKQKEARGKRDIMGQKAVEDGGCAG